MPEAHPIAYRQAWALATALASSGLKHVVISPGSRSTAMVLALHEQPSIRKHVAIDERSAAFMALGMARATDHPVAVLCTSGTAAANYYPAVIEARQSGVPLIVLTADRSALDRANGAPQSMHQTGLFGSYPVFEFDAAVPDSEEGLHRLHYLAWQAMDAAVRRRGPAHLNLPFDKPFEPAVGLPLPPTNVTSRRLAPFRVPAVEWDELPDIWRRPKRPIVVAGPCSLGHGETGGLAKAFAAAGIPVIVEHASGLTVGELGKARVRGFPWMLRNESVAKDLKPDLIIRLGLFPTNGAVERYLEQNREVPELLFAAHPEWASPHHPAGARFYGLPSPALLQALGGQMEPGWPERWMWPVSYSHPHDLPKSGMLTDGGVWRHLLPAIPPDDALWLSNSWAIRDMDLMGQDWDLGTRRVFSARGVSGIDGVSSQALGTALGGEANVTLVTGDIAFLHDSNALLSARLLQQRRLVIVVVNNQGGQIFRMLPVASHESMYDAYFGTPQEADIGRLCEAHGVWHAKATTARELDAALSSAYEEFGVRVVECVTDPKASMTLRKELWNQC